ncbi:MAG: hypothetical protein HY550_06565, partial [Elusimicrobia bacterium]|nr:hypothetical protein [Elusimicrobiota bacterium]
MAYNMYNRQELTNALDLLAQKLELAKAEPISIFVCGGSAMIMEGFVDRATRDVDILAFAVEKTSGQLEARSVGPLPEALQKAAAEVSSDLGLPERWINTGPALLKPEDYPEGCVGRAHKTIFSSALTIYFLDRLDLIYLKVHAAADTGPGKHVNDLLALKPKEEEMEAAAKWALKQDVSAQFRFILK